MAISESKLIVSLIDRLTGPMRTVNAAMSRLNAAAARNAAALNNLRGQMMDAVAVGYLLARSISAPLKASIDFEEKMSDIRKVVDFESPAAFKQMGQDIRALSLRIPIAADGLADIVAAAGQSDIANKDLLKFTELAAKVATAWDVTAGESGESLAKLKTALGLTVDETGSLADAINYLSNKTAASSAGILDYTKRVAPMAKSFGFTAEQAAALGAVMTASGFESEVAATSFMNAGYALTSGANATKGQRNAYKALGLTSTQVSRSMQKNAVGTLDDVLKRIRKLPKDVQAATMVQLFGKEARALGPLLNNAKLLAETMALVADKNKYAGSAQAEFETRSKTTGNALQLFRNRITDLAISVGDALVPALNQVVDAVGPIITKLSGLAQRFPKITAGIIKFAGALIGLKVASVALRFATLYIKGALLTLGARLLPLAAGFLALLNPLKAVGAALGVLRFALLGTGIGLALAGLAAAGTVLYRSWSGITTMVRQFGRAFTEAIKPLGPILQPVIDGAKSLFKWIDKMLPPLDGLGASWFSMGQKAGKAVGEALVAAAKFATELPGKIAAIDWSGLGNNLKASLAAIDFAGIWSGLVSSAKTAISNLRISVVTGLASIDWSGLGRSASTAITGALGQISAAVRNYDWSSLGATIGAGIATAWTGLAGIQAALIRAIVGGDGGTGIASAIGTALGNAITNINWIGIGAGINNAIIAGIKANLSLLNGMIKGVFKIDLAAEGAAMIQSLWDGMKSKFAEFIAWVQTIPAQIKSAIGNIIVPVNISPTSTIGGVFKNVGKAVLDSSAPTPIDGKRAKGGPVWPGGNFLVGERGPELFSPSRAGVISPTSVLQQAGKSAVAPAPSITNNVHVPITITVAASDNPADVARRLGAHIKAAVESADTD